MNHKPQETQEETQDDVIEQVIAQALSKQGTPPGEEPSAGDPSQEAGQKPEEPAVPEQKKNKRSAVYIYLLILFGAAFLMLLLAYFVQQRNSESAISDLRNTMNLSREQLMDEIEALEKEKEQLQASLQARERALQKEEQQRTEAEALAEERFDTMIQRSLERRRANALGWLERFCAEGDWLMAATVVDVEDHNFNEKSKGYGQWADGLDPSPIQAARWLELREKVVDNAGCLVIERRPTAGDDSDYTELTYIDPAAGRYDEETVQTANNLWMLIDSYFNPEYVSPSHVVKPIEDAYTNGDLERLNSGDFQPSTAEVFGQIEQDLIDLGLLAENEDGTVSALYKHDGTPITLAEFKAGHSGAG